jgi:hypothetical protein
MAGVTGRMASFSQASFSTRREVAWALFDFELAALHIQRAPLGTGALDLGEQAARPVLHAHQVHGREHDGSQQNNGQARHRECPHAAPLRVLRRPRGGARRLGAARRRRIFAPTLRRCVLRCPEGALADLGRPGVGSGLAFTGAQCARSATRMMALRARVWATSAPGRTRERAQQGGRRLGKGARRSTTAREWRAMNCLTMRSSSEWKLITTSRPQVAAHAGSPLAPARALQARR